MGKGMETAMAHVAVILGGSGSMHRSIEVLRALERISGASGKHALKRRLSLSLSEMSLGLGNPLMGSLRLEMGRQSLSLGLSGRGLGNLLMMGGLGLELRRDDDIVQVI